MHLALIVSILHFNKHLGNYLEVSCSKMKITKKKVVNRCHRDKSVDDYIVKQQICMMSSDFFLIYMYIPYTKLEVSFYGCFCFFLCFKTQTQKTAVYLMMTMEILLSYYIRVSFETFLLIHFFLTRF